jgi:hypothetical protein
MQVQVSHQTGNFIFKRPFSQSHMLFSLVQLATMCNILFEEYIRFTRMITDLSQKPKTIILYRIVGVGLLIHRRITTYQVLILLC